MERRQSDFGELVRLHRAASRLTQEELAERAGLSARAVSDIERGSRRRVYPDTARRLADALRLEDEERTVFQRLARGDVREIMPGHGRAATVAPAIGVSLDRFLGRQHELDVLLAALRSREARLVTLTGTGGIGKTRLAFEAAAQCETEFGDGFRVVALADIREASHVAAAIARALGVRAERDSTFAALVRQLRARQLLLVLDTFEHLLDAAPILVDLLAMCPGLKALVTSRAPLRVSGEHQITVPPLPVPPADALGAAPADLAQWPSVELLVVRIRAVIPTFDLDDANAMAMRDISRRLAGIPLAIELAARRTKHMSVLALRDQLIDRLDVLTAGARDLPPRQQTMRATVAWSYELLDEGARRLFRTLAVFAGGCSIEGARAVGAGTPQATLEAMSVLVDHSLVTLDATAQGDRYLMLDVIRAFAAEAAREAGDLDLAGERHAAHFLELARSARPHLLGEDQDVWHARLDRDHDNLRAALQRLLERGDADSSLRLTGALWMFWRQHGDFAEGRRWLRRALSQEGGTAGARAEALWGAAWLAYHQGDYVAMRALADEHLALARAHTDEPAIRNALTEQGMLLMVEGRYADSLAAFREALDIARRVGGDWILALSLFNLGHATTHAGDLVEGERLLREALRHFTAIGDRRFAARSNAQLAVASLIRHDAEAARRLASESLSAFARVGEGWGIAEGLEIASAVEGDPRAAARLAGAAERLREETATEPMPFDWAVIGPLREEMRALAGDAAWDEAWQAGRRMAVGEAVGLALAPSR